VGSGAVIIGLLHFKDRGSKRRPNLALVLCVTDSDVSPEGLIKDHSEVIVLSTEVPVLEVKSLKMSCQTMLFYLNFASTLL